MTLIKLAAYTLLGYVLYELYLGVTEGVEAKKAAASDASASNARANPRGLRSVRVGSQSGASSKRAVGRGVI